MSTHRSRRIGRRSAEQLLRGAPAAGPDALGDLLAAASAAGRPDELAGEQAAMAAFRSARLAPAPQRRRRSMLKILLAKVLTVKIAAAAATATAAGGIALAAATGHLPAQRDDTPRSPATSQVVETKTTDASGKPGAADKDKNKDNGASPSPSFEGLCHAYTAGAGSDHGKALENPAFTALITEAGGKDKVSAYCTDLLGDKPGKPSADHPAGKPSDVPTPSKPAEAGDPSTKPGR